MKYFPVIAALLVCLPSAFAKDKDVVLAEIDGRPVMGSEVAKAISSLPQQSRIEIFQADNPKKFLENYVVWKLLAAEARKRKIDESPEYARRLDQLKNDLLIRLLQENAQSEITADEKEVMEFYESHKADFRVPEKRRFRHILVSDEKKAREILKRLQSGAKFESEAGQHSNDKGTANSGGDVGWHEATDLPPDFSKTIFSMKIGEICPRPVKTDFGWHLVRLDTAMPERMPAYGEIKDEVRLRALNERKIGAISDMAKQLKAKADIKIYEERFREIELPAILK